MIEDGTPLVSPEHVPGRIGGSVAAERSADAARTAASVRLDTAAVKRVVLRESDELPIPDVAYPTPAVKPEPHTAGSFALDALLPAAERISALADQTGSGELAPIAQQLRVEMANLRLEVQRAAEEIRRLHEAIRLG